MRVVRFPIPGWVVGGSMIVSVPIWVVGWIVVITALAVAATPGPVATPHGPDAPSTTTLADGPDRPSPGIVMPTRPDSRSSASYR